MQESFESETQSSVLSSTPSSLHGGASRSESKSGKVRPGILLWALGVPIPIILLILIFRGCA
jgi:hypothetical protein